MRMEEKFKVLVTIKLMRRSEAIIYVTKNEYELLCNLAKIINDPQQPGYSPFMEVKKLPK